MRFILFAFALLLVACQHSSKTPPQTPVEPALPEFQHLKWLVKDSVLHEQFSIDAEGVWMYASAADKKAQKPERFVAWDEQDAFVKMVRSIPLKESVAIYLDEAQYKQALQAVEVEKTPVVVDRERPLAGLRIAIDPGHAAATFEQAVVEDRYIRIRAQEAGLPKDLTFYEADLTLKTALLLRNKLEAAGATVFLSREQPGSALGKTAEAWKNCCLTDLLQADPMTGLVDSSRYLEAKNRPVDRSFYRKHFNRVDIEHRADLINAFQPDLTAVIHFNVGGELAGETEYQHLIEEDFSMVFIPGGFVSNELSDPESRMLFLYKLLSDDVMQSLELSEQVMNYHENLLRVPAVEEPSDLPYLTRFSVYTESPGVYARNLKLTRLIHGPQVFGESLLQNNRAEALLLAMPLNDSLAATYVPARIHEVVETYYKGILDYASLR